MKELKPLRVLAIEDREADLLLALRAIRHAGWEPNYRCIDRLEALDLALKDRRWDVILMDFNVPGLDFSLTLARITERHPHLPVIMFTGSIGEERAIEMMRRGAWDLVLKDHPEAIGAALQRCLREAAQRDARAATESLLRLNESRLSLAIGAAEMGIWQWGLQGQPTGFWSEQCSIIAGRDLSQFGLADFVDIVDPLDQPRVQSGIARCLSDKTPFELEFRLVTRQDQECWVACHGRPHFDESGVPLQITGILQNITHRKSVEELLRQASAVFSSAQEGVLITDRDGTILAVNPAFCQLLRYQQGALIGQNARIFRSDHHEPDFYRSVFTEVGRSGSWTGELWNRCQDGGLLPMRCTVTAVKDQSNRLSGFVGTYSDISHIKASESQLDFLAHHDPLTRLPNRVLLLSRLQSAISRAIGEESCGAVLFFGIDRFKEVNDGYGHAVGDAVLREVANRCRERLRDSDLLARVGGDEFIVMLENLIRPDHAGRVAQNLVEAMAAPVTLESGEDLFISISVGISVFPTDGVTAEMIVRNADSALLSAKKQGRGGFRYSSEHLISAAAARVALDSALRRGLERQEFILHYQPLVETATRRIIGVEALVRWAPPGQEMIPPGKFIPMAEETGLIAPLGAWVLDAACRQFKCWRDEGLPMDVLAVNLSPVQFKHPDLLATIRDSLERTGLAAQHLELEITESALMDGIETEAKLSALKGLGVRLSIDDFGTGYSSLGYLKRFPIDKLKVDQSFVRDIPDGRADMEIVTAVISLARALHLEILAEGVETEQQYDALNALECTFAQGFLFSRPIAPAGIAALFPA